MKIFLLGYMGSGKSTIGKQLAAQVGFEFVDLDAFIETKVRMSITEMFEQKGAAYFRQLEAKALRSMSHKENCIIATGGGTPCYHQNIDWMNDNGFSVFLDVSEEILLERLIADSDSRPILTGLSPKKIEEKIKDMLVERIHFYSEAHLIIHEKKGGPPASETLLQFIKARMLS